MQMQEIKLVVGKGINGEEQNFYIYINQILGKGSFGEVKKARAVNDMTKQYAVKIIPIKQGQNERAKIQKQIDVLRILPEHPNIVKIFPIKCFSQRNFYIFMEYCKDGNLLQFINENPYFSQQKIINVFYQIMNGYRVLWENKIVHQDIKPQNIMVHKGIMKITDFGFSTEKSKDVPSNQLKGTLIYMSLQRLTEPKYMACESDDVFAIGIIMFHLFAYKHPFLNYGNYKGLNYKQYIQILKQSNKQQRIHKVFSVYLQGLYDIVLKMIEVKKKNRITCKEIYDYIDNQTIFRSYQQMSQEQTQQILLTPQNMIIQEHTMTYFIPFSVSPEKQQDYIDQIKKEENVKILNQEIKYTLLLIQKWVLNLRLVSYYFDRLARRLYIEKIQSNFFRADKINSYNKAILVSRLFAVKVSKYILSEFKDPKIFTIQNVNHFKNSQQGKNSLPVVTNDEKQIEQQISDSLKRTSQIKQNQITQLVNLSQKASFEVFAKKVQKCLKQCFTYKSCLISSRNDLITLSYMIDALDNIAWVPSHPEKLTNEEYFHTTQTKCISVLFQKVETYFDQNEIQYIIDSVFEQKIEKQLQQRNKSIEEQKSQLFFEPEVFQKQ